MLWRFALWCWWNELYAKFIRHFIKNAQCPDSMSFLIVLCLLLSSLLGNGIDTGALLLLLKKKRLKRGRTQWISWERNLSERNRLELGCQPNRKFLEISACEDAACGTVGFIVISTFSLSDPLAWTIFPLHRPLCGCRATSFGQLDLSICVNASLGGQENVLFSWKITVSS